MAGNKRVRGFTLVEMMIATAIAGVALALVSGVIALGGAANARGRAATRRADAAGLLMRRVAHLVKAQSIDYNAYGGKVINPATALNLLDEIGKPTSVYLSPEKAECGLGTALPCLIISTPTGVARAVPNEVRVDAFSVIVRPAAPFNGTASSVIIFVDLSLPAFPDLPAYHLQTQITERTYDQYD